MSNANRIKLSAGGDSIVFEATPSISESSQATYQALTPLHMPGQLHVYQGSGLRTFNMSDVKFLSRTLAETQATVKNVNLIRSWTKPKFGPGSSSGYPPVILRLDGYGPKIFGGIPCVLTNYTLDVSNQQAFSSSGAENVPIITTMTLTLQEVRSMSEINKFTLENYKNGSW